LNRGSQVEGLDATEDGSTPKDVLHNAHWSIPESDWPRD